MKPDLLLLNARTGDETALGVPLESYRNYLRLLARIEIGRPFVGPGPIFMPRPQPPGFGPPLKKVEVFHPK